MRRPRSVRPGRLTVGQASALNWLGHAVLAVGLVAPCMTFVSRMGEATEVARAVGLIPESRTYSVLSGILTLLRSGRTGDVVIGGVLLTFSVVFPIAKLVVVRLVLQDAAGGAVSPRLLRAVALSSRYSMVDVFVIALLVVASRTLPGGSRIELEWGTLAFCAAALLSTALAATVRKSSGEREGRPESALADRPG